jgi:hypothetical protein
MKLGISAPRRNRRAQPSLDNLFALADVRARMENDLGLVPRAGSGIVLHPLPAGGFRELVERAQAASEEIASDGEARLECSNDPYAFHWLILRTRAFGNLVRGIHAISAALDSGGWGTKLFCAVFPFEDRINRSVYWTYSYKWGAFCPLAPGPDGQYRDVEREQLLAAELAGELAVEPHLGTWFPLRGVPL